MSPDKAKELVAIYPELFSDLAERSNFRLFNFECGDGWFALLKSGIEKIKEEYEKSGLKLKVYQVKEKYGTLRFYLDQYTDAIQEIVEEMETQSERICEECGALGHISGLVWVRTLCEECLQKINVKV